MKRVLILSDIHAGSPFAVCLPEISDDDYQMRYVFNGVQNFLWDKWCAMCKRIGKVDVLILNGDLVEGTNKKEAGQGIITTNIHAQGYIAATLIKMVDAEEIYVTNGSKYHTGETSGDQIVSQMVDGVWLGDHQFIKIEDIVMHVRHKIGYSSTPYSRCTGQRKEAMVMKSQGTDVDIYVRSHTHRFNFSGDSNDITINTPCWKGLDHFMNQGSQEMPDNGYVLLEVDGSDYKWNYNIFNVPHSLYKNCMVI